MVQQKLKFSLLILFAIIVLTGMGRKISKDLSQNPHISWIIGKRYTTKDDLVVMRLKGSKKIWITEIGNDVPERDEIKNEFPYKYKPYGTTILGILPKGSVLEVKSAKEEGSSTLTFITYYAAIVSSDSKELKGMEVNATLLTDASDPPKFKPDLVEEVLPKSQ